MHPARFGVVRNLTACAALLLAGCFERAEASVSNCGPATKAYIAESNAGCSINDGGVFMLADGRAAPNLYVCQQPDGAVAESWCQP